MNVTRIATRRPAWVDHAECRGASAAVFFPERGESIASAKAICAVCPVRIECLEEALEANERYGVRGGLSVTERQTMRRTRHQSSVA